MTLAFRNTQSGVPRMHYLLSLESMSNKLTQWSCWFYLNWAWIERVNRWTARSYRLKYSPNATVIEFWKIFLVFVFMSLTIWSFNNIRVKHKTFKDKLRIDHRIQIEDGEMILKNWILVWSHMNLLDLPFLIESNGR